MGAPRKHHSKPCPDCGVMVSGTGKTRRCRPCAAAVRREQLGPSGGELEAMMAKIVRDELQMPWERSRPLF